MFGESISVSATERQDSLLEPGTAEWPWPYFLDFQPFIKKPFPVWKSSAKRQGREGFLLGDVKLPQPPVYHSPQGFVLALYFLSQL